jgi:uncharacterized protein (DUF58 family)
MGLNATRIRLVFYFILYILVILYAVTFTTTVAWFLLYAFTLLFGLAFLSSRQMLVITDVNWYKSDTNHIKLSLTGRSKGKLPFLLSSMRLTLNKGQHSDTQVSSCFFSRKITVSFDSIYLPRGSHDHLTVEVDSLSVFGLWKRRLVYQVPIQAEIYPYLLTKSNRGKLMRRINPSLTSAPHSSLHEFYVKEIRSYQHRDAFSLIDWKTSLRRGQWMVKDYEHEEEAPVDLVFYGGSETDFEFLLSVAYSLYDELNQGYSSNLYLIGEFDHVPDVRKTEPDFLFVQPATDQNALAELYRQSVSSDSKRIIIKPSDSPLPSYQTADNSDLILDEHDLHFLKGG